MDKYLNLIVSRFESYIEFLNFFEPTNEAALFINDSFIYNEMVRVKNALIHNKNLLNDKRSEYQLYYIELFHIYNYTRDSICKFEAMIYSLQNAIRVLNKTELQHL